MPKSGTHLLFFPEELVLVGKDTKDGPEHPLYSSRIHQELDRGFVDNIRYRGVQQAITIAFDSSKRPLVVAGRRRVLHAREANKQRKIDGEQPYRIACIEKLNTNQRELVFTKSSENNFRIDTNPIEKAEEAANMLDAGMTSEEVMIAMGWKQANLYRYLRLLKAPEDIKGAVREGKLNLRGALALLQMDDPEEREKELSAIMEQGGSLEHGKAKELEHKAKIQKSSRQNAPGRPPSKSLLKKVLSHPESEGLSTDVVCTLKWILGFGPAHTVPGLKTILEDLKPLSKTSEE